MQYRVYRNNGNSKAYPYLLDVQSDIIDILHTRLVIPLFPLKKIKTYPARRLNPVIPIEGNDYAIMTHEMASVRLSLLGDEVADVWAHRQRIKDALDFLLDGF
ncbi:CcdB family protein [Leminorella grimontii]|uniref:CcdB family protein n=1 Tax=Leminorella grimontii TaxID=82981 RepID=UPI002086C1E0|nr:CcdB family protein [Leminorella grimontii]GKX60124.1 plasmid maintenance protein CcdB [Leminorella grimontii]